MKSLNRLVIIALTVALAGCTTSPRRLRIDTSADAHPYTHLNLRNNPDDFQFAIIADRTGGHRPGVYAEAVKKLNLLRPEFAISIGDMIEGYTDDEAELDRQWAEFDAMAGELEMPFFYVPGNHDISSDLTARKWRSLHGRSYYHFRYRDVLFLCLNTEDGSRCHIGDEQIEYFRRVLKKHRKVRWTLVFMHQPVWTGESYENWRRVEVLLEGRPYTVFAGHIHAYSKLIRQGRNYYVFATTGGSGGDKTDLTGCRFDHVVWVTMTDKGPRLANLLLEGILSDDPCPQPSEVLTTPPVENPAQ